MNTKELETNLKELDQKTQNTGNSIVSIRVQISELYSEADRYANMAFQLQHSLYYEDDPQEKASIKSQADMYRRQAEEYKYQASQLEIQERALVSELSGYRNNYHYYMQEGERNKSTLQAAIQKLSSAVNNRYGTGVNGALQQTRQRYTYNCNLVDGCNRRISWIDSII